MVQDETPFALKGVQKWYGSQVGVDCRCGTGIIGDWAERSTEEIPPI